MITLQYGIESDQRVGLVNAYIVDQKLTFD